MAYAALISLEQTTKSLLNSSHIFIDPHLRPRIEFVCNELIPLIHEFHKQISSFESSCGSSMRLIAKMDVRTREAVCRFEDVLEIHVSNQLLSSQSEGQISSFYDEIEEQIDFLTEFVHKMEKDYKKVNSIRKAIGTSEHKIYAEEDNAFCELEDLSNRLLLEYESPRDTSDDLSTSIQDLQNVNNEINSDFGGINSKIVGLHDQLSELKNRLMDNILCTGLVIRIFGMVGIGKTTLAKQVYNDQSIVDHFDCRVWVTIGPKYNKEEFRRRILAQTNPEFDLEVPKYDENDELGSHICTSLMGKRYLIVVDDVWNTEIFDTLFLRFPPTPGGRIILTTRLEKVSKHFHQWDFLGNLAEKSILKMRFLNEEESWYLFCDKIFGKDIKCPFELEKVGKKIVQNCEGLPLAIVTIGDHLSKAEKTQDYSKLTTMFSVYRRISSGS